MKPIIKTLALFIVLSSCTGELYNGISEHDRIIIGYSKNMKRYKVVDMYGRTQCDVRRCHDIFMPGDTLFLRDEFKLCN